MTALGLVLVFLGAVGAFSVMVLSQSKPPFTHIVAFLIFIIAFGVLLIVLAPLFGAITFV